VGPVLLVDMVSGQTEEWTLQPSEHLVAVGVPILTVVMPDDSAPTALRAYDDHGELLWSAAGESWPIAVDDVIYTSSLSAEAPRGAVLSARDPLNGQALWTYEYVQGGEFLGSPGLAHGTLVVPEADAIVALDAATGRLNWQVPSPGDQVFVEPVELPGVIVLTTWSELGTSQLVGVDVNTGEHVWTGPGLENGWWDASRITDEGLLSSTGREYSIHHYDGTVTSFELTAPFRSTNPRIVSLDPLVVSSGYRLYGLDADIALSGEPRPRASE
jgi:outer membrane protein assembly factor BamB